MNTDNKLFLLTAILLIPLTACTSLPAVALTSHQDVIHTHSFREGESLRYDYDDTDITYCAVNKNGLLVASEPLSSLQIKIPVKIEVTQSAGILTHKMTLLAGTELREGDAARFASVKFTSLNRSIKNYPDPMAYSYPSEGYALSPRARDGLSNSGDSKQTVPSSDFAAAIFNSIAVGNFKL